ncbi:MAG: cell wall hydrolase [Magnetococcales bacterium]|nr:cell wall hydrolase [Magnetococcales bacterium]
MMSRWERYERFVWALTVWREASNQSFEAKAEVALVIKNRANHPRWWGKNLIDVCTKPEQFTSMNTKTNDPNLRRWPTCGDPSFLDCMDLVDGAADGRLIPILPGADHYFDESIPAPWWAAKHPDKFLGTVGAFHFYSLELMALKSKA